MPQSHLITTKTHLASLEGWRGLLALCVVAFHFSYLYFGSNWAPFGYLGVDFFFLLSGFIIARQYEASIALRETDFRTFAVRRLARLWPLYITTIGAAIAINAYMIDADSQLKIQEYGHGPNFIAWVILQITMLGSLTQMAQPNGPVWSVSVEWVVNLAFFALVWHYRRVSNILLWLLIIGCAGYMMAISPHSLETPTHYIPIARGIVGFCLGWLIFRYHLLLPNVGVFSLYIFEIGLLTLVIGLAACHTELLKYGVDYAFALVLFPALMMVSLYRFGLTNFIFSAPIFTFLGRISYSIYLLHYPLTYFMVHTPAIQSLGAPTLGIVYITTLIGLSTLTYLCIEKPGRWIGRKFTRPPVPAIDRE
jgi:peptidoglycan/LPS O-acetylase OafA/YrhL